jgi:diguanylate cyclase (GGDEF)-like protein
VHGPGGEVLGKVFVSLRLAQLQRVIEDSTLPGHAIALLDAKGQPVASSGTLRAGMRETSVPLPETGWRLVVRSPIDRFGHNGELHILAGLFTLAGVLVLLVMAVTQLRRPLQQETHDALEALACLTRNESAPPVVTRYEEFAPVAAGINFIAQRLHDQREQLAKLSLTDPLTELPNRRAFETRFPLAQGQAQRQHPVALVLLDIDHFKRVNDRYGHGVGDQVLLALARSMKALTRRADLAARLAGDEFVALLADLDASGVDRWYQRLSEHFRSELDAFGLDIQASLSAGQTWLGGASSDTVSDVLARADRALYQAKAQGRAQLVPAVAPAGAATE